MRAARSLTAVALALAWACSGKEGQAPPGPKGPAAGAASASPGASGLHPSIDRTTPLPSPLPEVVARVNGHAVPLKYVEIIAKRLLAGGDPNKDGPYAYRQATQQLIVRELLVEEAVSRKINPDPQKIEQAYNEARISYQEDAAWVAFLAKQGMTEEGFRSELRTQHTVQALLDQEAALVPSSISDEDALAFYKGNAQLFDSGERLRASHILLRVAVDATPQQKEKVRARAQQLLARIRKGEDFAKLAKENSEDKGSAGRGGQLDDFARDQMVTPFEQAAFALKPGEVSDVVETPFGFHIIKLVARVPPERLQFEPTKPRIKEYILKTRRQQHLDEFASSLRAKAKIETYI